MKILGIIRRQFKNMDKETFLILYKGFVRPHMEYAIQAWSPHFIKDIDCLEKVQRRATSLIKGFKKYSYEDRLHMLGLTTLEKRRLRGDLIETYKILSGKERINSEDFFHFNQTVYNLRGRRYTLATNRCRLELRKTFFSQRVVKPWNKTNFPVMLSQHLQPTHSRTDSTRCRVGNYKAEASMPDI